MMSEASNILTKGTKKYILQQSNLNLDVAKNRKDEKLQDINLFIPKSTKAMQETENFSPNERLEKPTKSNAKKLRSIRLDLSSLKRSFIDKSEKKMSSDESSEDEEKINKKPCSVVPNYVTNSDSGPCRKPRRNRQDLLILSSQNTPKLTKAQPLSIARRNARERNRVKQVNEGFATLRSRIPEYISEVYNEEKGRKSAKKLSKVETLRMAVDYIRHLEKLLNIKSTNKEWAEEIKNENRPWETAVEHSSPNDSKYPFSFAGSLGTSYDQTFECQDSMYYEYDLDLMTRRDAQNAVKTSTKYEGVTFIKNDEESEDDFRYYEILNRIRKGNDEIVNVMEEVKCTENLESSDRDPDASMFLKRDVESQEPTKNNVLPSITETFNKGIPVFF